MALRIIPAEGSFRINITHIILRFFQLIFAIIVLIIWATVGPSTGYGATDGKIGLVYAAAVLSILTAIVFTFLPMRWGYRFVALALLWDLIVCALWAAAFTYWHKRTVGVYFSKQHFLDEFSKNRKSIAGWSAWWDSIWLMLINTFLWLASLLVAIGSLVYSRGGARQI